MAKEVVTFVITENGETLEKEYAIDQGKIPNRITKECGKDKFKTYTLEDKVEKKKSIICYYKYERTREI